ncbi:glycosyltransferase family 4 protein [Candidatus Woesearchaeota archaeon]|nr:glycosyltransferase family 4 protein [Candidatus Woesearchaeota archaeon]
MKKLLITSDCFLPRWDGIARFLSEMVPRLKEKYDITLIVPDFPGEKKDIENVTIVRIPLSPFAVSDIPLTKIPQKTVKAYVTKADIVFNQTLGPIGIAAINAAHYAKVPVISYIHSIEWELFTKSVGKFKFLIRIFAKALARNLYRKCDLLLVPSLEVSELFMHEKIETKKVIIQLGTDTNKFKPTTDKAMAKQKIGIDPSYKVIGFSGRIGREKDLITLYRAFVRLRTKRKDVKLLIVGSGIKEYEEISSKRADILFVGSQNKVVPYLQAMDIYVLPSLTETSSLATMEAMACGLPVLVTPIGNMKEYIIEKENGCFFPKKNPFVLSLKLNWLLDDEQLRNKVGENARKTVGERFSWEETVQEIQSVLDEF